ncbi:MAG: nicotinate-nucleotide adenylyltransferase [Anaerolineales bacterium]|nr:nicotinate-nucleotide adenylyltransferase [Anaerolineales bacterium]
MSQRVGFFGGTFDPPHLGHLILAAEAVAQFQLDVFLWMLTPNPPHKIGADITPLAHRAAMVERVIARDSAFALSRVDIDRPAPHYTADSARLLAERYPNAELYMLIGGDSLHDLPTWRRSADLVAEVSKIGVMRRPNDSADLSALEAPLPGITAKTRFLEALLQPISSSEIRRRVKAREMYRYYLPPEVYEYIEEQGLYR